MCLYSYLKIQPSIGITRQRVQIDLAGLDRPLVTEVARCKIQDAGFTDRIGALVNTDMAGPLSKPIGSSWRTSSLWPDSCGGPRPFRASRSCGSANTERRRR